jgi:rhodanese-related sulfurtransferase
MPAAAERFSRAGFWAAAAILLAGAAVPPAIYAVLFGRVPTRTPAAAKQWLLADDSQAVLVDVRDGDAFAAGHLAGAVHWPLAEILAARSVADRPPALAGKTLLLVCDVGLASCRAARHLAAFDAAAYNVRGGIQEWIRSAAEPPGPPGSDRFDRWQAGTGRAAPLAFRESPPLEQAVAVLSFFGLKPIYTLLSLAVMVLLWPARDRDLVALRWAMICFFIGENSCAVNYLVFHENSYLAEYVHSFGMMACFGFTAYAILEGIDLRILGLSDPHRPCAALPLCRECVKGGGATCGLRQTFYLLLPALMIVALMLPLAGWQDSSYNTLVFGRPYNYAHLRIFQILENWYCAAAACAMLAASLAWLVIRGQAGIAGAKIALAAGLGPLGFGMFRMVLGSAYDQHRVWYLFWEEGTELLFTSAICLVLAIFRRSLLAHWDAWGAAR